MQDVRQRRWLRIFLGVTSLVLAQIAWWTTAFLQNINHIELLTRENLDRRRLMILSESVFFAAMTCVGLYLLYRALKTEERSREIQRNFIETVTHESKTPLTALKLRLESVQSKNVGDSKLNADLGLAIEEVRRLSSIFDKVLSLNRVERQVLDFENIALADVAREVVRRLDPFLKARKVEMILDLDSEAIVRGSPYDLENAVQSLIENAVVYNGRVEKRVTLAVKRDPSGVSFSVSDNGPGISEEDRPRLFERFYRGQSGRGVPGTGLGLHIAKTVIEVHGGTLSLRESTGHGSTFEAKLPGSAG